MKTILSALVIAMLFVICSIAGEPNATQVLYRKVKIDGLDIFYREAGRKENPTVLLLHGFPTSSHMFRDLIPALADKYHLVAPDYPGYGNSSAPPVTEFDYTFDRLADVIEEFTEKLGLTKYSIYLMDYGAPIGFRLASKHPERVQSLIVQNGNAYEEGLASEFWNPVKAYWKDRSKANGDKLRSALTFETTKWQYTNGVRNVEMISPDTWGHVQPLLDRPGNQEIQLALFYSYGSNPPLYPKWQEYLRKYQPPTLIVWGGNDEIFPAAGAYPYKRDLRHVEFHLFDTGHFALEEDGAEIAERIRGFLGRYVDFKAGNAITDPLNDHDVIGRLSRFEVKPTHLESFRGALSNYVSQALMEKGNIQAEAYSEQDKPSVLWLIERWANRGDLERFGAGAEARVIAAGRAEALSAEAEVCHVTDLEPLSKLQWRRAARASDRPLTVMLFVDSREGTQEEFKARYHRAMPLFRSQPGVVTYQLSQVLGDDSRFVTYEKFRSDAAFQDHLAFPPITPVIDYLQTSIKEQPFQSGLHVLVEFAPLTRE